LLEVTGKTAANTIEGKTPEEFYKPSVSKIITEEDAQGCKESQGVKRNEMCVALSRPKDGSNY
jgi:hypothetical protein